jgi:hypothetical protein
MLDNSLSDIKNWKYFQCNKFVIERDKFCGLKQKGFDIIQKIQKIHELIFSKKVEHFSLTGKGFNISFFTNLYCLEFLRQLTLKWSDSCMVTPAGLTAIVKLNVTPGLHLIFVK